MQTALQTFELTKAAPQLMDKASVFSIQAAARLLLLHHPDHPFASHHLLLYCDFSHPSLPPDHSLTFLALTGRTDDE